MLFETFGLSHAARKMTAETMGIIQNADYIAAKMLLQEAYQADYKIYDHERSVHRPLAVVAMHAKENIYENSMLYNMVRRFRKLNIGQQWNITMSEFFALPVNVAELIVSTETAYSMKAGATAEKDLRELEKQMKLF